jgi:transmembrane sensor
MTTDDPISPLIDRLLAGEASDAERARVAEWVAQDANRAALLDGLRAAVKQSPIVDTDAAWSRLAMQLDSSAARATVVPLRGPNRRRAWAIAAAAVAVMAVGALRLLDDGVTSIVAPIGQRVSATLPDGSTIQLGAGSRISWSRAFGKPDRDVRLDGEGYFDVVHDAARPFRVRARDAVAVDIGTRFVVRAWPELRGVEVAVEEGEVGLSDSASMRSGAIASLRAGSRGVLQPDGRVIVTNDAPGALGWTQGELVFDDAPLAEALPSIGRWYGVTIDVSPAMRDRRLTARFAQQPLPSLLEALGLALQARVVRDGARVTIMPIE